MSKVKLNNIVRDDSTVQYEFDASGEIRQFLTGADFFAEYDTSVADIPKSILTIPWLANICPIAWANNASISVPIVDDQFFTALQDIKWAYRDLYPEFMEGGEIRVQEVVQTPTMNPPSNSPATALMFSGGVDSLATFLRHRNTNPLLLSIHGFDVQLNQSDAWDEKERRLRAFGESHGLENQVVKANITDFQDMFMVNSHFKRYLDSNWFDSVQAGLGLLGLCAPIAYQNQITDLYMAGSYSAEFPQRVSFHPTIVNNVQWTPTTVSHDGYGLSRQEKISNIADYVRDNGLESPIHTCLQNEVGNCSNCEKCARTIAGLLLEGLDPNHLGYDVDGQRLATFRNRIEHGDWKIGKGTGLFWKDIQQNISFDQEYPIQCTQEFFEWLAQADIDDFVNRTVSNLRDDAIRRIARNTPYPVYLSFVSLYTTIRDSIAAGELVLSTR